MTITYRNRERKEKSLKRRKNVPRKSTELKQFNHDLTASCELTKATLRDAKEVVPGSCLLIVLTGQQNQGHQRKPSYLPGWQ